MRLAGIAGKKIFPRQRENILAQSESMSNVHRWKTKERSVTENSLANQKLVVSENWKHPRCCAALLSCLNLGTPTVLIAYLSWERANAETNNCCDQLFCAFRGSERVARASGERKYDCL